MSGRGADISSVAEQCGKNMVAQLDTERKANITERRASLKRGLELNMTTFTRVLCLSQSKLRKCIF